MPRCFASMTGIWPWQWLSRRAGAGQRFEDTASLISNSRTISHGEPVCCRRIIELAMFTGELQLQTPPRETDPRLRSGRTVTAGGNPMATIRCFDRKNRLVSLQEGWRATTSGMSRLRPMCDPVARVRSRPARSVWRGFSGCPVPKSELSSGRPGVTGNRPGLTGALSGNRPTDDHTCKPVRERPQIKGLPEEVGLAQQASRE